MANIVEIIIKATDKASATLGKTQGNIQQIGASLTKVGVGLTAGVTLPLLAVGKASISAASDLSEALSKVNVVFGDSADEITAWSEQSADAFGLSRAQALAAAGTFGNLFATMGNSQEASSQMSRDLVQLSADLGAFNDIDPTLVLDKLRAGITGESEPLKSLGILLTQANVEAKALEMGLGDLAGNFTAAEITTARYALIMEQSATAQGTFARESESLPVVMAKMKAELGDAAASIGENLLPIMVQAAQAIANLAQSFNELSPGAQKTIVILAAVAAAIGPLLLVVGQAITVFSTLSGLFATGGALAGAGATISAAMATAGASLAGFAAAAAPVVIPILAIIAAIAALYLTIQNWDSIIAPWLEAWQHIKDIIGFVVADIKAKLNIDWSALGKNIIEGIKDGITSTANSLADAAREAANNAVNAVKSALGIQSPSTVFAGIGNQMMLGLAQGVQMGQSQPVEAVTRVAPQLAGAAAQSFSFDFTGSQISNNMDLEELSFRVAERLSR